MAIKACFIPARKDSAQFIIRLLSFYIMLIVCGLQKIPYLNFNCLPTNSHVSR